MTNAELIILLKKEYNTFNDYWFKPCGGLHISRSIYLKGNTTIESLPDNLTAGLHLWLENCINLKTLPKNLKVGVNLNLRNCKSLTTIPEDIFVKGDLVLDNCLLHPFGELKVLGNIKGSYNIIQNSKNFIID